MSTPEQDEESSSLLKRQTPAKTGVSPSLRKIACRVELNDSGSEDESNGEALSEEEEAIDYRKLRKNARRIRDYQVEREECEIVSASVECVSEDKAEECAIESGSVSESPNGQGAEQHKVGQEHANLTNFSWSEDYSSFYGQEETYLRTPGPSFATQNPVDAFMAIWDEKIMEQIVRETNRYAWQTIAELSEVEGGVPEYLKPWVETTTYEMYRHFAMLILMSICYNSRIRDYWSTGIMSIPGFRKIMSRNRFELLTRFLHFINNDEMKNPLLTSYEKRLFKIGPILDHCNGKFSELYTPNKHLSLDESLLLWKGRLSWVQCIRTKAARFGIKSYELCEAQTGYVLKCLLYTGKGSNLNEESIHGFDNCTAKVVLELMDGYLDVGHTLVMDNWYNQLPLTRFLKRRGTDVIGTLNPRQLHVPHDIKYAAEKGLAHGEQIAAHCGDISLIAWHDLKIVTTVSTYHDNTRVTRRRSGKCIEKPKVISTYNKYMGGVDLKDQKLSMFIMERKRGKKWYMKVFKRMLNISLLNTFIIFKKNPSTAKWTHRNFRVEVALGLLKRFPMPPNIPRAPEPAVGKQNRLMPGNHFPGKTEKSKNRYIQRRCVRCTAAGRCTKVTTMCTLCNVPLCLEACWAEYHTLGNLR